MNILKVNGIDLAYESYGNKTDETILLIAGLGTQMIRWTVPFCEMLVARGFRVIRFDNRDTGLSTHFSHYPTLNFEALANTLMSGQRPDIPYTLNDMSDDAIGLLEALGDKKGAFRWTFDGRHDCPACSQQIPGTGAVPYFHHVDNRKSRPSTNIPGNHGVNDSACTESDGG